VLDWWRDFFNEDYIDVYGTEDAKKSEAEVEGIISLLEPAKGSSILDLCCGYGRHTLSLAQKGFCLTGLDFSEVLLEKAQAAARDSAADINLVRADMRWIPFLSRFDYVINIFTAFGYFQSEDDDQSVLNGVYRALKPKGEFLLDTINREWVLSRFQKENWEELEGGRYALDERKFDPVSSRISARTLLLGTGENIERRHSMRFYTLTEMVRMIERAGMRLISFHGHLDGRKYWLDTPRMVIRAEKPVE
jgi:ubiquinone/menaquinone biosynthesis C-methylase UbiE